MGPLSDIIGRRAGLLLCSLITLVGALLSTFSWGENVLIAARRGDKILKTKNLKCKTLFFFFKHP